MAAEGTGDVLAGGVVRAHVTLELYALVHVFAVFRRIVELVTSRASASVGSLGVDTLLTSASVSVRRAFVNVYREFI